MLGTISQNEMQHHLQDKINRKLLAKSNLAFICIDSDSKVVERSENLADYGFKQLEIGDKAADHIDFLTGADMHQELALPVVVSPNGHAVAVNLVPDDGELIVIISDASERHQQQQLLQQQANDNELLLIQQRKLMAELELAQKTLQDKNAQLEEASRLQTGFLSGVSHEFRTPLTSIIGYTDLLMQSLSNGGESDLDYLDSVQRSSKHLLSLVENLLDHGKLDSGEIVIQPKAVNLASLFEDVAILLKPLASVKHIDFNLNSKLSQEQQVMLDDSRLRQCLINLLGNAIKFTDEGSVSLDVELDDEQLTINIADTGLGIRPEDLDKIRQPFWQASDTGKAGTGLGLTITERIVELLGGSLDLSSVYGEGTQVKLSIHAPAVVSDEISLAHPQSATFMQPISILLAEDDSDISMLVCLLLEQAGAKVTCVENGQQAVDELSRQAHGHDLVLMDINMPIMTGYEAIQILRSKGNDVPIVVMTASAIDADRSQAELLGCDAYLVKPIDVTDVIKVADQLLANIHETST